MNVEIGAEAALFPEKEYIMGIFLAVYMTLQLLHSEFAYIWGKFLFSFLSEYTRTATLPPKIPYHLPSAGTHTEPFFGDWLSFYLFSTFRLGCGVLFFLFMRKRSTVFEPGTAVWVRYRYGGNKIKLIYRRRFWPRVLYYMYYSSLNHRENHCCKGGTRHYFLCYVLYFAFLVQKQNWRS